MESDKNMLKSYANESGLAFDSRKLVRELYTEMRPTIWVLMIVSGSRHDNEYDFFGGVCIGSRGLIVTPTKALLGLGPSMPIYGRPYGSPNFMELEVKYQDSDLIDLSILGVVDGKKQYYYADVSDDVNPLEMVGLDVLTVDLDFYDTFTCRECYVPCPPCTLQEMVEDSDKFLKLIPNREETADKHKYVPVYGLCFRHQKNKKGNLLETNAGCPIFDIHGKLSGVICTGIKEICFAIPSSIIQAAIKKFEEKQKGRSKQGNKGVRVKKKKKKKKKKKQRLQ